ncbi:MAG: GntR family transcriptional regulator [Nocardioidaceae bacterium]
MRTGSKGAQLQEILESYVNDLEPGSPLPSERELADRFGVARMTVRGQLERLVHRGLVYRQPGRGPFVAERMLAHTERLTSFTEDMRARGLVPGARLLATETIRAGRALAARLEVSQGSQVVRVRRVRTADDVPMAVEQTHLPARRFPGLAKRDLATGSLYDVLLTAYDVQLGDAVHRVTVVSLGPEEAKLLAASPGQPSFRIERTTRDTDGVVVEYASSVYRGDRYELLMHARR